MDLDCKITARFTFYGIEHLVTGGRIFIKGPPKAVDAYILNRRAYLRTQEVIENHPDAQIGAIDA